MAEIDDKINGTTGGFTSAGLKTEEEMLVLPSFGVAAALEIGQIAFEIATARELKAAIEVRIGEWTVFHASLPGTNTENDWWMGRKARVVLLTGRSSIHE
ncbi:MAG: heme-binding protein, partial [Candidatus Nanopelagicaceae bacterium]